MKPLHPSQELVEIMQRIYDLRMTTTSGGNLSVRDGRGMVWMTPGGVDKGALQPSDIVWLRADGTFSGRRRASSERHLHEHIYAARPDVGGVLHAHSPALVACSMARTVPEVDGTGFAPFAVPGTDQLGEVAAQVFASGANAAVMENHGVVTAGATLTEAFHRFEALEFEARTLICARRLGAPAVTKIRKPCSCEPSETLVPSATRQEETLRETLATFTRRACRRLLFTGMTGCLSARLDEGSFLLIRGNVDRAAMSGLDVERVPLSDDHSHARVYRNDASVGSIAEASPVHVTAFSRTGVPFETRTIPESYVVIRKLDLVPSVEPEYLSPASPAVLVEGAGVFVTGRTVLEVFDRLEVIETTAEALIDCRVLGGLSPLKDDAIAALASAYPLSR